MTTHKIALSAGDGVGKELIEQVKKIISALEQYADISFDIFEFDSCQYSIDMHSTALRDCDLLRASECDAVLFGNIGGMRGIPSNPRHNPAYALMSMRRVFQVCTNIRPVYLIPEISSLSPLKSSITRKGMDILIVRDLMGGMINSEHTLNRYEGSDLEYYNEQMIDSSALFAFNAARARRQHITSVDKANVLASSKLWRNRVSEISTAYGDIRLTHDYVDHAAMDVLMHPSDYDVLLTSNVFGDILADEISQITGAPWLFGSAELNAKGKGVYTPNQLHHPRSDELSGRNEVSPYGILDAFSMCLRYSCERPELSDILSEALRQAMKNRMFTKEAAASGIRLTTDELGSIIAEKLKAEIQKREASKNQA